ncbi:MAG: phospholipase D-like domain-containing protein [Myxococcota bacterium]
MSTSTSSVDAFLDKHSIWYNRLEEIAPDDPQMSERVEKLRERDPNGRSPLTKKEWDSLSTADQAQIRELIPPETLQLLARAHKDQSKARTGRKAHNVQATPGPQKDERTVDAVGITSTHNLVDPLFSDAIEGRGGDNNYMKAVFEEVSKAEKFIYFRAFELENPELVALIIEKAKQGVRIEGVLQPVTKSIRPDVQAKSFAALREAAKLYPNLNVVEADIVADPSKPFDPIMHVKEFITDGGHEGVPTRMLAGINFGNNSPNNVDTGRRTRGEAALDGIQRFVDAHPYPAWSEHAPNTDALLHVDRQSLRKKMEAIAKREGRELATITVSGSGTRRVHMPPSFSAEQLQKKADLGQKIVVSAEDAERHQEILIEALENGSQMTIVYPEDLKRGWIRERASRDELVAMPDGAFVLSAADALEFSDLVHEQIKSGREVRILVPERLKSERQEQARTELEAKLAQFSELGATVCFQRDKPELSRIRAALRPLTQRSAALFAAGEVVRDESSRKLMYRELDRAIERKESIDIAAFALTDVGVLERIAAAHRAGCPVRVVVDDLEIDGNMINRKAVEALGRLGVPIRVFDDAAATKAAQSGVDPELVKLHAKCVVIGITRDDGEPAAPRVLDGTSNISETAFSQNTEAVDLVQDTNVAEQFTARLMDLAWEVATPIEPSDAVLDEERLPLFASPLIATPIEELRLCSNDTETGGFANHFGDRVLENAGLVFRLDPSREEPVFEAGTEFDIYSDPGFKVPESACKIHGLDREELQRRGAKSTNEGVSEFVETIQRFQESGDLVPAGQNYVYDTRMIDGEFQREAIDGIHYTLDGPHVELRGLSERVFPDEDLHNLDVITTRFALLKRAERGEPITLCARDAAGAYMSVLETALKNGSTVTLAMESGPRPESDEPDAALVREEVPSHRLLRFNDALHSLQSLALESEGTLNVFDTWSEDPERPHLTSIPEDIRRAGFIDFAHFEDEHRDQSRAVWESGGAIKPRFGHDGLEDAVLTAKGIAASVHRLQPKTLADLLPTDSLYIADGDRLSIYARSGSKNPSFQVEGRGDRDVRVRRKTGDGKEVATKIKDLRVTGQDKGRVQIEIDYTEQKEVRTIKGYVPADQIRFRQGGAVMYGMREKGVPLQAPQSTRGGEVYQPHPAAYR